MIGVLLEVGGLTSWIGTGAVVGRLELRGSGARFQVVLNTFAPHCAMA